MGDRSQIQWTDATWNPVTGCSKVSPGCAHCYAERVAIRLWPSQYPPIPLVGAYVDDAGPASRPRTFTDVQCHEDRLDQPLRWRRPRKVFVNSMSDLFHEDVPDAFIDRVFAVMALAPQHTFQVLTKRAERMRAYLTSVEKFGDDRLELWRRIGHVMRDFARTDDDWRTVEAIQMGWRWPLPNVWLGVSVENQRFADERIPLLLQTPAAVRFISAEPLLGPIGLVPYIRADVPSGPLSGLEFCPRCSSGPRQAADGVECPDCGYVWSGPRLLDLAPGQVTRLVLDWVIVGGESGKGARPFDVAWARSIIAQCGAAGVPVFVKQIGAEPRNWCKANAPEIVGDAGFERDDQGECDAEASGESGPCQGRCCLLRDRKGGDMAEWPEDLRVRETPCGH